MWLQLLQRSLHLSQKLPRGPAAPISRQGSTSDSLGPALDIRAQVGTLVKSYQASLQELMTQLLVHWKVLLASCIAEATAACVLACPPCRLHLFFRKSSALPVGPLV